MVISEAAGGWKKIHTHTHSIMYMYMIYMYMTPKVSTNPHNLTSQSDLMFLSLSRLQLKTCLYFGSKLHDPT